MRTPRELGQSRRSVRECLRGLRGIRRGIELGRGRGAVGVIEERFTTALPVCHGVVIGEGKRKETKGEGAGVLGHLEG